MPTRAAGLFVVPGKEDAHVGKWVKVYLDEADRKKGHYTELPEEIVNGPGGLDGWLSRIKWKEQHPARLGPTGKDDLDEDEEVSGEEALEVEEVKRPYPGRKTPNYTRVTPAWYASYPALGILRSNSRPHEDYETGPVPDVIGGLLLEGRRPKPLPETWMSNYGFRRDSNRSPSKRADPEDLEVLLAEFPDVEEEVTDPVEVPMTNIDIAYRATAEEFERETARLERQFPPVKPVPIFEHCAECDIDVFDMAEHNQLEHTEPEPSCRWCQRAESKLILDNIDWVIRDPFTCMRCYEDKMAPDWVKGVPDPGQLPVPEVNEAEVAAAVLEIDMKLAIEARELKKWKREELPYLLKMVKAGYDPVHGRMFKNLSVDQRILLDAKLARGGKKK